MISPPIIMAGVIDLITMKMLTFGPDKDSKLVEEHEIPDDMKDDAQHWRMEMLERLYNFSNEMMELALAEKPIPEDLIHKVLRETTLHMAVQPVMCGSALHGMGVQPVLDAVMRYLPSPADMPPVEGEEVASDKKKKTTEPKKLTRKPDPDEPFSGLVFKVLPAKTGDIHWVRVYSGTLKSNSRVLNPGKDIKENVAQLWHIQD